MQYHRRCEASAWLRKETWPASPSSKLHVAHFIILIQRCCSPRYLFSRCSRPTARSLSSRQSRRLRHGTGRGVVCRRLGRQPNSIATKNKKRAPQSRCSYKDGRRLTFPQTSAVSSARAGLTSLFGMGRGEHRLYNHPNNGFDHWNKTYKGKLCTSRCTGS